MASDAPIDKWSLTGNEATNSSFLGTTNNQALRIRTNNTERMKVLPDGKVVVNRSTPFLESQLTVQNESSNTAAIAIYGGSTAGDGVWGRSTSGDGIVGITSLGNGVWGQSDSGRGVVGISTESIGVSAMSQNENEMGFMSSGNNVGGVLGGSIGLGASLSGSSYGAGGFGRSTDGIGVIGVGNSGLSIITPPEGAGVAGTGDSTGVFGHAINGTATSDNSGNSGGYFSLGTNSTDNTNRAYARIAGYHHGRLISGPGNNNVGSYYGGYFEGGVTNPAYSYVGIKHNTNANGAGGTNYKIIGSGNVSTLVDDSAGNKRVLFAPEAPEILFEDYGVGKLQNGSVYIEIDPLFAKSIHVSEKHPLKVFIQLEGECNGVFVTEKTASGFLVKELNGGTSNTPFSYHIVANRADDIASDGSIASKHVGLRFPIGPGPAEMMETKAVEVKEDKVKHEKAKDKTAASTESDIQAVEKHSSYEPQLLQEQQPADTPVKSSNNNMQLQESK